MVNIFKKLVLILTSVIVFSSIFISAKQTHAIGFVGSNALKSAVINSMESAGVKFADKTAKDKAFDAWNMKAYEKWKEDEAAGRNADLWAHFNGETQKIANQAPVVESIPDKPGLGKMLLDATWFGMAISIGAEVGFAIEDAQKNNTANSYLSQALSNMEVFERYDLSKTIGLSQSISGSTLTVKTATGETVYVSHMNFPNKPGNLLAVKNLRKVETGIIVTYELYAYDPDGRFKGYGENTFGVANEHIVRPISEGYIYDAVPKSGLVPSIVPNPHLEPLIAPNPDIDRIREVLPIQHPVPITVPITPETIPYTDDEINSPYTPAGEPEKPPVTDPEKPPVTTPGQDPNKKPLPEIVPEPGAIKDPLEQPKEIKEENLSCERVQRPDFEPLGNAFTTSFPFSLPWDLKRYLDASFSGIGNEKPKFPLPFFGDDEIEITIPDALDKYVKFFKGFLLIVFDLGIIYLFVRVMRGGSD